MTRELSGNNIDADSTALQIIKVQVRNPFAISGPSFDGAEGVEQEFHSESNLEPINPSMTATTTTLDLAL